MRMAEYGASGGLAADRELAARCREGDLAAFKELYMARAAPLLRMCVALLHDRHDAEDAMQLAFARAFEIIDTYNGTCLLSTWLQSVAFGVIRNLQRSRRRRSRLVAAVAAEAPSQSSAHEIERTVAAQRALTVVQRALEKLPEEQR